LPQPHVGPAHTATIDRLLAAGLTVWEDPMSTVCASLRDAFAEAATEAEVVLAVTLSNGFPRPRPRRRPDPFRWFRRRDSGPIRRPNGRRTAETAGCRRDRADTLARPAAPGPSEAPGRQPAPNDRSRRLR